MSVKVYSHTFGSVRTKVRNDNAGAFRVTSRGARTENVVANRNPKPSDAIIWNGTVTPMDESRPSMVNSPIPRSIIAHPRKFYG
jgi:hypothetical protein